jgi:hypothetical protein
MVLEHQVRQKALDHLQIFVVKGPSYSETAMERFLGRLKEVLGASVRLELVFVDEIQRSPSGKHRYFVSNISSAQFGDRTTVPDPEGT